MNNIKHHRLNFVLFLCTLTVVGCSKIEHTKNCVPHLAYELPKNTEFVLSKMKGNIGSFLRNNDLPPWFTTEMEHKYVPENINEEIVLFHAGRFILTGSVLEYEKSPFATFDSSDVFFNVKIGDHVAWMNGASLHLTSKDYSNENNQENLKLFINGFGKNGKYECIKKNK